MTLTLNSDCTSLEIVSTLVDDFVANPALVFTITLSDCDATEYDYTITAQDITEGDPNVLTITPELIISDSATEFPDGVYSVSLVTDDDGTLQTEVNCLLVSCDLECRVFDYQSENLTSNIYQYYQALQLGSACDNCNCSGMCALYNKILQILGTTIENDCGCQ